MKRKEHDPHEEQQTIIPTTELLVPYAEGSSSDDTIHLPHCPRCDAHIAVVTYVERGLSDSEEVKCPVCFGSLYRNGRIDSHFKSTIVPRIIAWLDVNPLKPKTLRLAFSDSASETQRAAIQNHIEMHDFTNFYAKMDVYETHNIFQLRSRKQVSRDSSELTRKKLFSKSILLDSLKLIPPERINNELPDGFEHSVKVKTTDLAKLNPRLSPSYLARLREEWKSLQNATPRCSTSTPKKRMKNLSSRKKSTKKDSEILLLSRGKVARSKTWSSKTSPQAKARPSNTQGAAKKEKTGSKSKKKLASSSAEKTVASTSIKKASDGL